MPQVEMPQVETQEKRGSGSPPKVGSALELDHELQPIEKAKKKRNATKKTENEKKNTEYEKKSSENEKKKKNSNTVFASRAKKIN